MKDFLASVSKCCVHEPWYPFIKTTGPITVTMAGLHASKTYALHIDRYGRAYAMEEVDMSQTMRTI